MRAIDAHVHIWTPDVDHYPVLAGTELAKIEPRDFSPEILFKHSKPSGVDRIVLIQMSFYGFDNSYMLDAIHRFPESFRGVAVVDHRAPDLPETMRRLRTKGVSGFRIRPEPGKAAHWLQHPGFRTMFETAAATRQALGALIDPDGLPELDRMCKVYPQTPVVIDHMARIGVDGMIRDRDVDALCALAVHRHVAVKVSAFYALGNKKPPHDDLIPLIERLLKSFGSERLMWASDCPFQILGESYEESVALVRDRMKALTTRQREDLLSTTAQRIYSFPDTTDRAGAR